jgi:hypothetical protein
MVTLLRVVLLGIALSLILAGCATTATLTPQQKLVHAAFDYCAEEDGQRGSVWFNFGPTPEGRYQLQGYTSVFTRSNCMQQYFRDVRAGRHPRPN